MWGGISGNCPILEHISFVKFAAFYEDLLTNPCGADMHYLVKNSDLEKICVWHDTRDKLIERGVPYWVSLSWEPKKGNTGISISNLPNLGETATVTVLNADPENTRPPNYTKNEKLV